MTWAWVYFPERFYTRDPDRAARFASRPGSSRLARRKLPQHFLRKVFWKSDMQGRIAAVIRKVDFVGASLPSLGFQYFYELHCDAATTLYAMALQPTKRGLAMALRQCQATPQHRPRVASEETGISEGPVLVQGAWCREDRKKSYKPGAGICRC